MTEPTPPSEKLNDAGPDVVAYLEKMLLDAYKREADQEENVWRTLPLFATSIGLLAGLATLLHNTLPPVTKDWFPILTYGALVGMFASIAALFYFLFHAARRRRIRIPIEEPELLDQAVELIHFFQLFGADDETEIDEAVLLRLRRRLLVLIADATATTRDNNNARVTARARASYALGIALVFAFALIITIFVHDALK